MNGMLHIRTKQNGQMFRKFTVFVVLLSLILSGCSTKSVDGMGRGDWTIPLFNEYAIEKVNSSQIVISLKDSPSYVGASIVISNYFVTSFQLHDPYICLRGIETQSEFISEDELRSRVLVYYLINTNDHKITGPFEVEKDYTDYCSSIPLSLHEYWLPANSKVAQQMVSDKSNS